MENKYCFYCMSQTGPDGICPVCGHKNNEYEMSAHHIPPGTMLAGRYVVGRVLGEGGFGITYLGFDERLATKVAIKEYFPKSGAARATGSSEITSYSTGDNKTSFERGKRKFLGEARNMAQMSKQQVIVNVREFFEENNTAYIIMEYIEGVTLAEYVRKNGKYAPDEFFRLIEPVFGALSALHADGLIHRDISPDNLMLENGRIRLIDLGISREAGSNDTFTVISAKQNYSPLEQYQTDGQGPWSDIYSLGATIYFCLTGKTPPQAHDRINNDRLELPPSVSDKRKAALVKAMALLPDNRFKSAEEMHKALYDDIAESSHSGSGEPPRHNDLMNIMVASAAVVLVVLIGVFVVRSINGDSKPEITATTTKPETSSTTTVGSDEETPNENEQGDSDTVETTTATTTTAATPEIELSDDERFAVYAKEAKKNRTGYTIDLTSESELKEYAGFAPDFYNLASVELTEYGEVYITFRKTEDRQYGSGQSQLDGTRQLLNTHVLKVLPLSYGNVGTGCLIMIKEDGTVDQMVGEAMHPEYYDPVVKPVIFKIEGYTNIVSARRPDLAMFIQFIDINDDTHDYWGPSSSTSSSTTTTTTAKTDSIGVRTVNDPPIPVIVADVSLLKYEENKDNTITITGLNDNTFNKITIPDTINGKKVTVIADSVFEECTELETVELPDSIKSIGVGAFYNCTRLKNINIPDSVQSIGEGAFYNCTRLKSINIPKSVKSIGTWAFGYCAALTSVNILADLTSIEDCVFYHCTDLESVKIPTSVTSIGAQAFEECESLNSLMIPYNVTSIGFNAFSGCKRITSVTIPAKIIELDLGVFSYCTGLTSVTITGGIKTIGEFMFSYCTKLGTITIPDSVTSIGNSAFQKCESLTSIIIPKSVKSIAENAFDGCPDNLTIITPDGSAAAQYADNNNIKHKSS